MKLLIDQIADANNKHYGRSFEKLDVNAGQIELELILTKRKLWQKRFMLLSPPKRMWSRSDAGNGKENAKKI